MTHPEVMQFLTAINNHSSSALYDLMTEEHEFIDSMGRKYIGKEMMKKGWEQYFEMIGNYQLKIEESFSNGNTTVLFGSASGFVGSETETFKIPVSIRAVSENGKVAEWQVYADNKPVYELLENRSESEGV